MDIHRIVTELRDERQRLETAIKAIEGIGGHGGGRSEERKTGKVLSMQRGGRHLSAEARRRISEAQKRRWARRKKAA